MWNNEKRVFYSGRFYSQKVLHLARLYDSCPRFEALRHDMTFPLYVEAGSKSETCDREIPQDDLKQRCPDITKARQLLDWQPTIALDQELSWTIDDVGKLIAERKSAQP